MINFEMGEKLIKEAEEYFDEAKRAHERGSWNIVVRRAQEVVELSLKGLLKIMGAEYPKVHDPAEFFMNILERRKIQLNEETREKLERISADLSEKRAPAFYFEKDYSEREAEEAKEGAEFVLKTVRELQIKLKG